MDGESPVEEPGGLSRSRRVGAKRDAVRAPGGRSGDADHRPGAAAHPYSLGHSAAVQLSTQRSRVPILRQSQVPAAAAGGHWGAAFPRSPPLAGNDSPAPGAWPPRALQRHRLRDALSHADIGCLSPRNARGLLSPAERDFWIRLDMGNCRGPALILAYQRARHDYLRRADVFLLGRDLRSVERGRAI